MKKNLFLVAQAATLIKPFGFFSRVLSQWSRTAMFLFYFLFITLVGGQEIDAQIFCGLPDTTSTYNPSSGGLEIISTNGARLNLEDILVPANRQQLNTCMYDAATNGGNFNFEVDFGDSYGVGFNANTPHADSMRAVICQVLKDLSFFLQASPTCEGTLPTLRVLIASGSQGPNPSGAFALASAASYFYNHSNATMSSSGIMHTSAWRVLNGGDEPTTLPLVVGQAVYHTKIWYNSHPNLHYNLDMGQPYTNSVAHYDLYQITLHEMLHALGIASAIDSGGHSKINDSNQNYELYTRFDSYLFDTLMNPIVPNADNCFQTQCIPSAPLMGGCEYIMFNNNNNPNLWIYTPTDWQEGSSLSHFGDTCQTDSYVMHYKINTASAAIRRPHPDETKVLCAIGYATTDRYGDGSLDFHTHQDSEGNWTINPTVPCGNISAGNDDEGIGCDGKYIFQCLPDTIRIADLLANDRGVDTATATITCFRSIRGNIDYTLNDGLLIINNASTGLNVLTYLPTNPNTGEHTNATNVYFYVQPCMDNCTLTEDCNVVCNPSLYLPQCTGVPMPNPGGLSCATTNYSWGNATQTPDYTEDLFYTSIDPGIFRIIVSYGELPYYSSEAFMGSVNVAANKKYITMVRKKIDNSNPLLPHDVGRIHLILTDEIPPPPDMLMPIGLMAIEEHNITNTTWNTALSCFTADQDYHTLFVCAARDTAGQLSASLLFDRIDIIPDNFPSDTTLINHAACNTVLGLGDSTLCMPIEQIRYQWQQQDNNSNNWNTIAGATTPYWEVTTDSTASCTWYRLIRYVDTANNYAAPVAPTANGACIADTAYYQICVGDTLHIVGNTVICQGGTTILSADIIGNYTWSNGASTQTITVSMAGTYTVTVTNGQGCTATAATAVVLNPLPNANITGNTTICSGQSTTLTATGGGTYTWSNGASTQTITVSMAGTYTVTVTNAQGCTATATATVTVNPLPNITTTTIQPTCGLNNGSISVTPTNGTYAWTGGLSGSNPTGVAAGTYTVTVTSGACQATTSVTLSPSSALVATATTTQPTCGLNNGSISVTPTNGIYNWTGGLSGSNPTGVAAGIYTVTVTSGACQATTSVTLSPSSPLVATATTTQPTCGLNNGSISVTPTNGIYNWTGGLSGSNPTGVAAGIYTVTVTSGACQATTSVTLSPSSPLIVTATTTQPTCGLNNGSISVTPTNGIYNWTGGLSGSNPTGVASGIYTVTVTSGACQATTSVTLSPSSPLIVTASTTQPTCGLNNGSISVTPTNGIYNWTGGLSGSNPTGVASGIYTVTVTSGACQATTSVTLNSSQAAIANITGNTTICSGQSTALTATGGGTYAWSNNVTTQTITVSTAGTYTVTVTNGQGCSATATATVVLNPIPMAFVSGSTTICVGSSAILSVVGAGTYLWNNGQTNTSINVSSAGTYTVTVTDNGCSTTGTATIAVVLPSTTIPQFILPAAYELCRTDSSVDLTQYISNYTNVTGGTFIVTGNNGIAQVIADFNPMFNPANFPPGTYQIYYGYQIPFECDPVYSEVQTLTVSCCGDETVDNLNDLQCCLYNTNFTINPQFYEVTYPIAPDRPALVVNGGTPGQVIWTAANNYFTNLGLASPNDDILLDVDLLVPPNVTLLLEGGIHLKFAPNRRILVQRGGLLRINANPSNIAGNVILEGICNTVWQGIQVEGPGSNPTNLQSIPRITASHNFGVITTNSCEIRDAIIGIAGMALPLMDINNLQTVINTIPDFNPQNGVFVPSLTSLLLHNNYIASTVATSSSGGVVRINSRTIFDRCLQGVNLSWYNNKNIIDPAAPVSRLLEGHFQSTAPLHFPLGFLARSETGVHLHFYANLNIGDILPNSPGCNFINQTYGIRANEANKIYCYNNDFVTCRVGASALNAQITGGLNMDIDNNNFTGNLVGIQASGSHISITRNQIGNGSFIDTNNDGIIDQYAIGIFLRGADFEVRNNNINQQLIGTAIMNNGTDINTITDNTFQQMLMGVWAFGDNGTPDNNPLDGIYTDGTQLDCNYFDNYWVALQVNDYMVNTNPLNTGSIGNQGDCTFEQDPADNSLIAPVAFDIQALHTGPTFTYNYWDNANNPQYNPNILGSVVENGCLIPQDFPLCNYPTPLTDGQIGNLNIDKYLNKELVKKLFYYLKEQNDTLPDTQAILGLLESVDNSLCKRHLLPYYYDNGELSKIDEVLATLPTDKLNDYYYLQLQLLFRTLLAEQRSILSLTPTEQANLRNIADSQTASAFDAQAILAVAYGEEYPIPLPDLPYFVSPEIIDQYAGQTINFKTTSSPYHSKVYPNPAGNRLYVDYTLPDTVKGVFELCDLHGRIIHKEIINTQGRLTLDTHNLQAGIYYCKVYDADGVLYNQTKLVIIH